jgi:hypothetical protein
MTTTAIILATLSAVIFVSSFADILFLSQVAALQEHVRRARYVGLQLQRVLSSVFISCSASEREARANSELAHMRADKQRLESLLQVNPPRNALSRDSVIRPSSAHHAVPQDAQNKLREAPTVEEVAWLREREKSFSAAVDKMKQECATLTPPHQSPHHSVTLLQV